MTPKSVKVNPISSYEDMLLMLKVFKGCIVTKVMPKINSPCHFKLIEIIERAKVNRPIKRKKR